MLQTWKISNKVMKYSVILLSVRSERLHVLDQFYKICQILKQLWLVELNLTKKKSKGRHFRSVKNMFLFLFSLLSHIWKADRPGS